MAGWHTSPAVLYAKDQRGRKTEASPRARGFCPSCRDPLVPKCGDVRAWHWAHRAYAACDEWLESEDAWHLGWKRMVRPQFAEVPVAGRMADMAAGSRTVLLRRGSLKPNEYAERGDFFVAQGMKLMWVWDVSRRTRLSVERSQAGKPKLSLGSTFVPFKVNGKGPIKKPALLVFDVGKPDRVFVAKWTEGKSLCVGRWMGIRDLVGTWLGEAAVSHRGLRAELEERRRRRSQALEAVARRSLHGIRLEAPHGGHGRGT